MNALRAIVLLLIINTSVLSAQSLAVGIGGGVSNIQGKNFYTTPFDPVGLYFGRNGTDTHVAGLNIGATPTVSVTMKHRSSILPVDLVAGVRYLPMRGDGVMKVLTVLNGVLVHDENVVALNDVWCYRLGLRGVYDLQRWSVFLGASATLDVWKDAQLRFEYNGKENVVLHYTNGTRYGADIDAGAGVRLFDRWEAEASATYSFLNEWGRRDGEVPMNTLAGQLTIYYTIME